MSSFPGHRHYQFTSFIPSTPSSSPSGDVDDIDHADNRKSHLQQSATEIDSLMKSISQAENFLSQQRSRVECLRNTLKQARQETDRLLFEEKSKINKNSSLSGNNNGNQRQEAWVKLHLQFCNRVHFMKSNQSNVSNHQENQGVEKLFLQLQIFLNWFFGSDFAGRLQQWFRRVSEFEIRIKRCQEKIGILQSRSSSKNKKSILLLKTLCDRVKRRRQFHELLEAFLKNKKNKIYPTNNSADVMNDLVISEIQQACRRQIEQNSKRRELFSVWNVELAKLSLMLSNSKK